MKNSKPFFSVIIPTYNRFEFLDRAVVSVIKQSEKDFELIIVDDGSTDQTSEYISNLLKKFSNAPLYSVKTENRGVSAARNTGVGLAKGEWIAFLDSDDEWKKNKLKIQRKFISENPHLSWLHGNEIWLKNGVHLNQKKCHQKSGGDIFIKSLRRCLISPSAVVIRKELFNQSGGFDESFVVCEDYDLWLRLLIKNEIGFCSEKVVIKHGGHDDQLSEKFKGMDHFRVKSMAKIFLDLDDECRKLELKNVLLEKCDILMKGYMKYKNIDDYKKVKEIKSLFV